MVQMWELVKYSSTSFPTKRTKAS